MGVEYKFSKPPRYKITLIFAGFFCIVACNNSRQNKPLFETESPLIVTEGVRSIPVEVDKNNDFNHLDDYLYATSYIKLESEPLIAGIKNIHIIDDRIYVWDKMSQIICYNMEGNVIYKINAKGNGPGEYSNINAFTVNPYKSELIIYDNLKLTLFYYSSKSGKYLRSTRLEKPNPTEIAFFDQVFFYNNRYHKNYPNDERLRYSLLVTADGLEINKSYFPHNDAEEEYIFSSSAQTFYNNDAALYYCRNFDNVVYSLGKDTIKALYKFDLPLPLPFSKIEEKADEIGLIKSDYSLGLSDVYECDSILFFRFTKKGYYMAGFYDLRQNKQICCVRGIKCKPDSKIPLFSTINGVYKKQFYGVLSPDFINYMTTHHPGEYPDLFKNYDADNDNPVIGFYKVNVNR